MKRKSITLMRRCSLVTLGWWVWFETALANIPKPPAGLIPDQNQDFIDVLKKIFDKAGPLIVAVVGVAMTAGVVIAAYKAYKKAQENNDMGIFWSNMLPAVILVTVGMVLLYLASQYFFN